MEQEPPLAEQLVQHPGVFGIGVGVANGVLAAARNKPVSPMAAYITAGVIAIGEVALVRYDPTWDITPIGKRANLWHVGIYSFLGTMAGLALFISREGRASPIQRAGERLGERAAKRAEEPSAAER